ncbi:MAG: type II toxin-antitoxin system HipA family toxin [Pseudomonadota bacterium]
MATKSWGKVYFQDVFAGLLEQQPGGRFAFTYDPSYLASRQPAIAHTLPLQDRPHSCEAGLHPFFDNLVAEGWLRNAQARALGVNRDNRFALLLAFGQDCAGAVSVLDPEPPADLKIDLDDAEALAALASRASLSGTQPKLLAVKAATGFRPARAGEVSTHVAKLPSGQLPGLVEIEFLTTLAYRALLPGDAIVATEIAPLGNVAAEALMVRRFDRTAAGRKLHFEEFAQLLGRPSESKYEGAYEDMGRFIRATPSCIPLEAERLYRRILACILTGNTDAHSKNFAMLHTLDGLRLAPAYDLVAASLYKDYQRLALALGGASDLRIGGVQPTHIIALGAGFDLGAGAIRLAVEDIGKRMEAASDGVNESTVADAALRDKLIDRMEKRWTGTFASIGQLLSRRRSRGGRHRVLPKNDSPR